MNVQAIPIDLVDVGDRLRAVDEDFAELIAASMAVDGQRVPVEVRRGAEAGRYTLIAGAHRVRAAQIAGLSELQAVVMDVTDLEAKRLEIEENLCRRDLSELDRSTFLAEWKQVYEELNAAVKHGGKRRGVQVGKIANLNREERFSRVAADRLGLSEAIIQRAERRYRRIPAAVRERIAGTWLADHAAELDLLGKLRPEIQAKVVDLMLARGATSIKGARDEVLGIRAPVIDGNQQQLDTLNKAWGKAGPWARKRFLADRDAEAAYGSQEAA